jgi:hypothetical protein
MKLSFILELLVILLIVAYGAYGKPLSGELKALMIVKITQK